MVTRAGAARHRLTALPMAEEMAAAAMPAVTAPLHEQQRAKQEQGA